ncbi:MAG: hypothetical protein ACE5FD_03115 [Anaerolineae bacterium]
MTRQAKKDKKFRFLRGTEKGEVRYEVGDVVTSVDLHGWPVKALIAKGALEEVK